MKNKSKKQAENIDDSTEKLLLSDVIGSFQHAIEFADWCYYNKYKTFVGEKDGKISSLNSELISVRREIEDLKVFITFIIPINLYLYI